MVCFEVSLNGERVCLAGIGGAGVLMANLVLGAKAAPPAEGAEGVDDLALHTGGLRHDEGDVTAHVHWARQVVRVGDEITIRVVESEACDAPDQVTTENPEERRARELDYYRRVKAALEEKYAAG